jgi:hypothetical protein
MSAGRIAMAIAAAALLAGGPGCGGDGQKGQPLEAARGTVRQADFGHSAVRVRGLSPTDVAGAAVLAAYPGDDIQPNGLVLARMDNWREALLAAQFSAPPVSAAVLPRHRDYLPTATSDLVQRLNLRGFPRASGLKAVVLGQATDEVFGELQQHNLQLTQLKARSPQRLALEIVPFRGGWAKAYSDQIVIVSSDSRGHALAGAAWSAYSGDTLAFVGHGSIPDATRKLLVQRQKLRLQQPHMYVIGPPSAISSAVEGELRSYGSVTRIGGPTPADTSVALARFHDAKTGFGWGLSRGPGSWSFVNPRDWGNAFGAFAFASAGPMAPLLLTRPDGTLTPSLRAYLRSVRGPRGGQGFVLGDESSIPQSTLTEVDGLLAPGPPQRGAAPAARQGLGQPAAAAGSAGQGAAPAPGSAGSAGQGGAPAPSGSAGTPAAQVRTGSPAGGLPAQ